MSRYKRDLRERARVFAVSSYRLSFTLQAAHPQLRDTCAQLCRSASSIGANLTEGEGLNSRRELAARYAIAMREARETSYWLKLIEDVAPETASAVDPLLGECKELIAMTTAALRKLRSSPPP